MPCIQPPERPLDTLPTGLPFASLPLFRHLRQPDTHRRLALTSKHFTEEFLHTFSGGTQRLSTERCHSVNTARRFPDPFVVRAEIAFAFQFMQNGVERPSTQLVSVPSESLGHPSTVECALCACQK